MEEVALIGAHFEPQEGQEVRFKESKASHSYIVLSVDKEHQTVNLGLSGKFLIQSMQMKHGIEMQGISCSKLEPVEQL